MAALAAKTTRHVMTYGFAEDADVRASDVTQHGAAMRFTLCLPDGSRTPVELALPGRHNVQNALAAAAIGWQLGVTNDAMARALQRFAGIGRRFNLLAQPTTPKGATVDVKGCPSDADGDVVFDGIDTCPDTPKGVKVDSAGCPMDTDGDGVFDGIDQCPDTLKCIPVEA